MYKLIATVADANDINRITFEFNVSTLKDAERAAHIAMQQLGFKSYEYTIGFKSYEYTIGVKAVRTR